jgi:hypothetical protein
MSQQQFTVVGWLTGLPTTLLRLAGHWNLTVGSAQQSAQHMIQPFCILCRVGWMVAHIKYFNVALGDTCMPPEEPFHSNLSPFEGTGNCFSRLQKHHPVLDLPLTHSKCYALEPEV